MNTTARSNPKSVAIHLLIMCVLMLVTCQKKDIKTASTSNPEEKHKQVKETIDKLITSLVKRDKASLEQICSEGLSYGHSNGIIQNKAAFIDDVMNGPFKFLRAETENQEVELYEDLAIVKCILVAQGIREGDTINLRLGTSSLFKFYEDGRCQLILRQGYKL